MKHYDIIIIGAGASGLMCALLAKTNKNSILILEHMDTAGKKIPATGNGRCNLTNEYCKVHLLENNPEGIFPYNSDDTEFVRKVLSDFDADDTIRFFDSLGMFVKSIDGYIYPRSMSGESIRKILLDNCLKKGVEISLNIQINRVEHKNSTSEYIIDNKYSCRNLVFACGGRSAPKMGSDGSAHKFIISLGHKINKFYPALCALKCAGINFKSISGVRCESRISLYEGENFQLSSYGNVLCTDYGISGIPAFQISGPVSKLLHEGAKLTLHIDLLPEFSEEEIAGKIKINPSLTGILNSKLVNLITHLSDPAKSENESPVCPVKLIKNLTVNVTGTMGFENSQVSAGGVPTADISPGSMESKIIKGLYFTGEVIDVDGICGGYNLQWAFSTAAVCANALRKDD